jgi:hypothetical protein
MPKGRDIIGERFGRLLVLAPTRHARMLKCECECGTIKEIELYNLLAGRSQSCGCGHKKHGHAKTGKPTAEYQAWRGMIARVRGYDKKAFKNYGGRGVTICEAWLAKDGFQAFLAHIGPRPSPKYSLDRYPDPYGNYEPGNVRWATRLEQAANKRAFSSEDHGRAKLTEEQVAAIRSDTRAQHVIGEEHGISQGHVSHIVNRKYWRAA